MSKRPKTMQEEMEELRDLVREAHGVLGDLRRTIREAREMQDDLDSQIALGVGDRIESAVTIGLSGYTEEMKRHVDEASEAVYNRFDTISKILLERDDERPGLEDLVLAWGMLSDEQKAVITRTV